MNKAKRAEYLDKITPLEQSLDTGRVWLFSNSYSEAHKALSEAVSNVKAYLSSVSDKDDLEEKEQRELWGLIKDVQTAAEAYIKEKKEVDHYALDANKGQGIKAASGDKLARLKAADGLKRVSEDFTSNNILAGFSNRSKITQVKLRQVISARDADRKKAEGRERSMRALSSLENYKSEKEDYLNSNYKIGGKWADPTLKQYSVAVKSELKEGLKLISSLHRDEILSFGSRERSKIDEELLTKYKATRLDIEKAVRAYNMLEKYRESGDETKQGIAEDVLLSVGITGTVFKEMGIKRTELKYMGKYFDTRAKMMKSPCHINMTKEERKELEKKSISDLVNISKNAQDKERSAYIRNMARLKQLSVYGIRPIVAGGVRKEANTYEKVSEGERTKGVMKFLNVYVKGNGPKLKELYPKGAGYNMAEKKKSASASIGIGAGAVTGKVKVVKLSGKLKSKNGLFKGTGRLNVGRAAAGATVGLSLSASSILQSKIQLSGEAEATAVHGVIKGEVGNTKYVAGDLKADGKFLHAGAKGGISAGLTSYVDGKGDVHQVSGIAVGVEAMASLAKGQVSGGFTICGVRFGAGIEGVAGGIGGTAGAKLLGSSVSISLGAALGLGFGLNFSVDWSGLKNRLTNWRNREKQRDKIRENEAAKFERRQKKKLRPAPVV